MTFYYIKSLIIVNSFIKVWNKIGVVSDANWERICLARLMRLIAEIK